MLSSTLKMEVICSSEMLVYSEKTAFHSKLQDHNLSVITYWYKVYRTGIKTDVAYECRVTEEME
jgi:hypothetical protein